MKAFFADFPFIYHVRYIYKTAIMSYNALHLLSVENISKISRPNRFLRYNKLYPKLICSDW